VIYSSVDFVDFENAFRRHDRLENFPNTLKHLFRYLDELSDGMENGMNLDVISICCHFSEYDIDELKLAYSSLFETELDPESDEYLTEFLEDLECKFMLIYCNNGYFLIAEQ
jgi:hypothetical protein